MAFPDPVPRRLDALLLDDQNPRLRVDEEGYSQDRLLEWMLRSQNVIELGESIAQNGYMPNEPVVVLRADDEDDHVVLEGNRRVAALKLLANPELAAARNRQRWQELADQLAEQHGAVDEIDVHVVDDRESSEVNSYLAVRHVKGTKTWPPAQKAAFIAKLLGKEEASLQSVARMIGSNLPTVKRHYGAHVVVRTALDNELPGAIEMYHSFGVLLRAFQSADILRFLGIGALPDDVDAFQDLIPEEKLTHLEEFIQWTFGTKDREAKVLPESRQMTAWGVVLSSQAAVDYLRTVRRPNFWVAYEKAGGQTVTLVEHLQQAAGSLRESVPIVPKNKKDQAVISAFEEVADYFAQLLPYLGEHVSHLVVVPTLDAPPETGEGSRG